MLVRILFEEIQLVKEVLGVKVAHIGTHFDQRLVQNTNPHCQMCRLSNQSECANKKSKYSQQLSVIVSQ